jgi:hypothetical protein
MDGATLQQKIYSGYGMSAQRIGKTALQYRPVSAMAPINTVIGTLPVSFTQNLEYSKFNTYANATWTSLHDGSLTLPGDYLVTEDGTWFIAAQQPILPILTVGCNRVINVLRVTQPEGFGVVGYSGDTPATETAIMAGWPASILQGTKGEKNPAQLPGDERTPWLVILVPEFVGIVIRNGDIITDDIGNRYVVSSPELSDLGWRITAALQVA